MKLAQRAGTGTIKLNEHIMNPCRIHVGRRQGNGDGLGAAHVEGRGDGHTSRQTIQHEPQGPRGAPRESHQKRIIAAGFKVQVLVLSPSRRRQRGGVPRRLISIGNPIVGASRRNHVPRRPQDIHPIQFRLTRALLKRNQVVTFR